MEVPGTPIGASFLGAQAPLGIARVKNNNKNKRTKKFQSSIFGQIVRDDL